MSIYDNFDDFLTAVLGRAPTAEERERVIDIEQNLQSAITAIQKMFHETPYIATEYGVSLTTDTNFNITNVNVALDCTLSESQVLQIIPILSLRVNKQVEEAIKAAQKQLLALQDKAVQDLMETLSLKSDPSVFPSSAGGKKNFLN